MKPEPEKIRPDPPLEKTHLVTLLEMFPLALKKVSAKSNSFVFPEGKVQLKSNYQPCRRTAL
jgi:hypothetical protein